MAEWKQARMREELMKYAANFLERESNRESLITVTNAVLSADLRRATIFISVFPNEREAQALDFTKRHAREFRLYLSNHARMRHVPQVEFALDRGEQNRQRIDELSRE